MRSLNFQLNMSFHILENAGGITSFMMSCSQTHQESSLDSNFATGSVLRNTIGLEEKGQHHGENGRFGLVIEGMEVSVMVCS